MDLLALAFNESLIFEVGGEKIKLTLLPNNDTPGEYAFGIDAPRSVAINREEVFIRKKFKREREKKRGE